MTEYLIIVALIGITAIGITSLMSNHVKVGFGRIANALKGEDKKPAEYKTLTKSLMEDKDMGNFTDGVDRE